MDKTIKDVYMFFSAYEFNDGGVAIPDMLYKKQVPASFSFTGTFYMQRANRRLIRRLVQDGHYLGPHSGSHLLYAPWDARDSTLITRDTFIDDLRDHYPTMATSGIPKQLALPHNRKSVVSGKRG